MSANVATLETRQLTEGDWDDTSPLCSPVGSSIAFISSRLENRRLRSGTEAYVISNQGGEPQLWSGHLGGIGALAWAPNGDRLLALASEYPGYMVIWQSWLYFLEPHSKPVRLSDDSFRPNVAFPSWAESAEIRWQESGDILLLGDHRGESYLYQVSENKGTAQQLLGGGCQSNSLSLDSRSNIAVIGSSNPNLPSYLDCYELGSKPKLFARIDQHNHAYLSKKMLGSMHRSIVRRGDVKPDCRLFLPPDFDSSGN